MLPLAPDYYRRNFLWVAEYVHAHRAHLMSDELSHWLDSVSGLEAPAQCLYLRLLSRTGSLFRSDRCDYREVPDLSEAVEALTSAGLTLADPSLDAVQLGKLLRRDELLQLPQLVGCSGNKAALVAALPQAQSLPLQSWWPQAPFELIVLTENPPLAELQLLFFANARQSLTDFVLAAIGQQAYEPYPLDPSAFPLQSPGEVQRYLELSELSQRWQETAPEPSALKQLQRSSSNPKLERRRQHLVAQLARQLEREGQDGDALALLSGCHTALARERRLRLLFARGDFEAARNLALALWAQPESPSELALAQRFLKRLKAHLPITLTLSPPFRPETRRAQLPEGEERVEAKTIALVAQQGGEAWFSENRLIPTVAALMLWETLFLPLPGAFVQPFQSGPLDFYHPLFCARRQGAIEQQFQRWQCCSQEDFVAQMLERFERLGARRCQLMPGVAIAKPLLRAALTGIEIAKWVRLVRFLLSDLVQHRAGMPDLLVSHEGQLMFVEVKGPGDSLRDNQRRWLAQLNEVGLNAWVLELAPESEAVSFL
ncbi:VRR-NUC domain-containing protein [Ferrimonas marina]|uniref:phosphodiesterase I n=1 Tax=Ferrimonas marina TaxID=299255 RepID=A0A1M5VPN9_9GAMM|nr:VRR-NUC domain-containing protein [Ferrimonas marina]SHH77148.1 VRR-NUC domain-containing protein [Ferrimonas marina]